MTFTFRKRQIAPMNDDETSYHLKDDEWPEHSEVKNERKNECNADEYLAHLHQEVINHFLKTGVALRNDSFHIMETILNQRHDIFFICGRKNPYLRAKNFFKTKENNVYKILRVLGNIVIWHLAF